MGRHNFTSGCNDVVIIGSGIAGSSLALNLEKKRIDYVLYTDQKNPLSNTTSLSFGHCRVPDESNLEETISLSVQKFGEQEERAKHIYEKASLVSELFNSLKIEFQKRSFGIIPTSVERGGHVILRSTQEKVANIRTNVELIDFIKINNKFELTLKENNKIFKQRTKNLVLATGGFGGKFKLTDNFRYNSYDIFDMVAKNGGEIININEIFIHPFGYSEGRRILIGKDVSQGKFVDKKGKNIFDEFIESKLKNDNYHNVFDKLVSKMMYYNFIGEEIYFIDKNRKIKIVPTVHYTAGGIKSDYLGEVENCGNLYAIGECRYDGNKNGGRLPGYALTSAIVDGKVLSNILENKLNSQYL